MDQNPHTKESVDLVQRIKTGDRSAETILYDKFKDRLLYFVSRKFFQCSVSESAATVEDVCQDAWLAVLENLRKGYLEEPEKLPSYIYQVFSNKVIDAVKKIQGEKSIRISEDQLTYPIPEGEQEIRPAQKEKFAKAWKRLTRRERRILYLRYFHSWSHNQIAELVGISEPSCRKALQRAKEHFRKKYEGTV